MPVYLTIQEVCELLRLGERTVYQMCRSGEMAGAIKVGGQWRVDRTKLLAWLEGLGEQKQGKRGARNR